MDSKDTNILNAKKEPVRIYIDGCFDLIHSGHYNAIRQAKALGDILVVGVNSDAEILKNKGPSVLNGKERADIIRACKWVDEVYEDTEYCVSVDVLDRYNCQYYAHGDDPCIAADGTDMCKVLDEQGRFKMFKRTEGVSTTDIVGKLLALTQSSDVEEAKKASSSQNGESAAAITVPTSSFLATTRRIMHFSNSREPKSTDRVVYIQGSFDLLHNGHIETLKQAKAQGDFLYVGVWGDDIVNYFKGSKYPVLSLHERVLMVLACKYVDDVVIGCNYQISKDQIKSLNISKVVHPNSNEDQILEQFKHIDPYQVAKEQGIFQEIDVDCNITLESIAERVLHNRETYQAKFDKKKAAQDKYYEQDKKFVQEI